MAIQESKVPLVLTELVIRVVMLHQLEQMEILVLQEIQVQTAILD
jgi:hypothetical protein